MGTRADFYVGRGSEAEWLGSVAWDGYPDGFDAVLFQCDSEDRWRVAVGTEISGREDGTVPDRGWPWPWDDSGTTDYAYAYENGQVYGSSFGSPWFEVDPAAENGGEPEEENRSGPSAVFPNMADRKNVTMGSRSGVMVFGAAGLIEPEQIDAAEQLED